MSTDLERSALPLHFTATAWKRMEAEARWSTMLTRGEYAGFMELGRRIGIMSTSTLTWVLVQGDGIVFARGHDQIRVSPEGKIVELTTFAPSVAKP